VGSVFVDEQLSSNILEVGVLVSKTGTTCVIPATCTSTLVPATTAPSGIILPLTASVCTGVLAVGMSDFIGFIAASGLVQTALFPG